MILSDESTGKCTFPTARQTSKSITQNRGLVFLVIYTVTVIGAIETIQAVDRSALLRPENNPETLSLETTNDMMFDILDSSLTISFFYLVYSDSHSHNTQGIESQHTATSTRAREVFDRACPRFLV
jgi:hypothetical protein